MANKIVLIVIFILISGTARNSQVNAENGKCIMDEVFDEDIQPVIVHRPRQAAPLAEKEQFDLLSEICPHLVTEGTNSKFCCNGQSISSLNSNFNLPKILLGRCPSCFENFKTIICELACNPNQDNFLQVVKEEKSETGLALLKEINYYVDEDFAEATFRSCQNVQGLTPGSTVLDIMCGQWGGKDCTAQRWMDFMGATPENGGMAPYQINFQLVKKDTTLDEGRQAALKITALKCSEAAGAEKKACSCVDCKESCNK